ARGGATGPALGFGSASAPPLEPGGERALYVVHDLRPPLAERPPGRRVGPDGRTDGDVDSAERAEHVGPSHRDRRDWHTRLQGEVPDPDLERSQRPAARVASLGEDEDDSAPLEDLVDGPQPRLVQLAAMRRDRKYSNQGEQPPLPGAVEDRLPLGHGVDHRALRKERDDEGGIEPGLVVGGDYARRLRDVRHSA